MQQIELEKKSFLPIYRQVASYLRDDILSGKKTLSDDNGKMPSEQKVAKAFNINRVTLRKALSILEKEGLITRSTGKGTYVVQEIANNATIGTKRIGFLGFTFEELEFNLHTSQVFHSVEHSLAKMFRVENIMLHGPESVELFEARLREIPQMQLDGLLVSLTVEQFPLLLKSSVLTMPHVVLNNHSNVLKEAGFNLLDVDNDKGIRLLLDHLRSLGHKAIAFVSMGPVIRHDTLARQESFQRAVVDMGLNPDECPLIIDEPPYEAAVEHILTSKPRITAVMGSGYFVAGDIMNALKSRACRIPEDISITGFDYYPQVSRLIRPTITTVRTQLDTMGARAAEILCQQMLGKQITGLHELIDVELLVQRSTAAASQ